MKHKFNKAVKPLLLLLTMMATTTSCVKELGFNGLKPNKGEFSINYSFDEIKTMGTSALANERVINDACLIFYKEADGSYVSYSTAQVNSGTESFPLTIPDAIIEGDKYKVLVVGNYNKFPADGQSISDYIEASKNKSYIQMKQEMLSQSLSSARMSTPLPFSGILLGADGKESLLTGPAEDATKLGVSIKFSRAVARFDLRNMVPNELRIKWVKVCNYRDRGYFFHSDSPAGKDVVVGTSNVAPTEEPYPVGYVTAPVSERRQNFTSGGLYAYPNIVPYVAQDDKLTTCLMIAGYYQKEGEPINDSKLSYYRANIASNQLSQVLKPNYIYTIVVNNVKSEGADSEDGAIAEGDRLLDYTVGDDWDDDSGNTVVDDKGNYLTVSRATAVLDSQSGEGTIVKVAVKEGTTWDVLWLENFDGAFRAEKIDNSSFRIVTTGENNTPFIKNGSLNVRVNGTNLVMQVGVMQLSSSDKITMLTVDGKTGEFDYKVPGQGGVISLQVLTGGGYAVWEASVSNELSQFIGKITSKGAHKGYVEVEIKPNISEAERSGKLIISRNPKDGIPDVVINFIQPKSPYFVSVFPNYSDNGLNVDGFYTTPGGLDVTSSKIGGYNGLAYVERFWVTLADPANYTFDVESSFKPNVDAYITLETPKAGKATYTDFLYGSKITGGRDGNSFYLHVFRTGPGDSQITGSIIVTAMPKESSGLTPQQFSFNVNINTSCQIGDSQINIKKTTTIPSYDIIIADRNVGAPTKLYAAFALNYSNKKEHPDNANVTFKGDMLSTTLYTTYCAAFQTEHYPDDLVVNSWFTPSSAEIDGINELVIYSKQRAFIISKVKTPDNKFIGCYFPLSGSKRDGVNTTTDTRYPSSYQKKLVLTDVAPSAYDELWSYFAPHRCVKKVPVI